MEATTITAAAAAEVEWPRNMEGGGCTIDAGRREGGGVREAEAH